MPNIQTPEAILSYPRLFEPGTVPGSDEKKYSATFVFESDADLTELKKTAIRVAKEEWGSDLDGAEIVSIETEHGPDNFLVASGLRIRLPWRDDESVIADKGYPEGSAFISARSTDPVGIVSRVADPSNDGKPAQIIDASGTVRLSDGTEIPRVQEVYAGARAKGLLSVYAYGPPRVPKHGVGFGLAGVQVVGDGERLDGRADPTNAFDADVDATADLSDLTEEGEDEAVGAGAGEGDDLSDLIG